MVEMTPKQVSVHKHGRVRAELGLEIRKVIMNFKSECEPRIKLTDLDVIKVLNDLLTREIYYL